MTANPFTNGPLLPAEVVFSPAWWYHHEGITFDEDFFYHPLRRVEAERRMERALYDRWGRFGLGKDRDKELPLVGPVHIAAGYLTSEMLGCKVEFEENGSPQVICAHREDLAIDPDQAFASAPYRRFERLCQALADKYGFLQGDIDWNGILNNALDLRGEALYLDFFDRPAEVESFFAGMAAVLERFFREMRIRTGTTSICVNRSVRHLEPAVYLHSECSHTMISTSQYERFLFKYDAEWSEKYRPFGIHFCGHDPHRFARSFARLPHLDFLDVGWGGDVAELRRSLPDTFLNIRLSPVEIGNQPIPEIETTIRRLIADSGNPRLTGVCCINMDEKVPDEKITALLGTVEAVRQEYAERGEAGMPGH